MSDCCSRSHRSGPGQRRRQSHGSPLLRRCLPPGTRSCQRLHRRSRMPSRTARSRMPAWPAHNSLRPGPPRSPAPPLRPMRQPVSLPRRYPRESSVSLRPGVPGRSVTSNNRLPINRDGGRLDKTHPTGNGELTTSRLSGWLRSSTTDRWPRWRRLLRPFVCSSFQTVITTRGRLRSALPVGGGSGITLSRAARRRLAPSGPARTGRRRACHACSLTCGVPECGNVGVR